MVNGSIEIQVEDIKLLNLAQKMPFSPTQNEALVNEELRYRYRYLDLRRESMQKNLKIRAQVLKYIRDGLTTLGKPKNLTNFGLLTNPNLGFTEIETPILFKSTPEGAREFIVPTRAPGKFYALTQSPQQVVDH